MTTFTFEEYQSIQVLQIENLLNEYDNRIMLEKVEDKIESGFSRFAIDLSDTDFMNSVGLNFLIAVRARSQEKGGDLVVVNPTPRVQSLLEMTKLETVFDVVDTMDAAVQHFES